VEAKLRRRKQIGVIFLLIIGTACVCLPLFLGLLTGAGEFLVHADTIDRGGAVVLLSGGDVERLDEATRLMQERYADLLVLTDTGAILPDGMMEWQYMRLELIARGVSPAQIQKTYRAVASTRDEALAVREYLQRHQVNHCIVVTDPFHTRRTRLIFRAEFEGSNIDVQVTPATTHWYRSKDWFLSARGWQTTISEYVKLLALWASG
jgi:uncharacterized SAM-binding protein YcdF (DUF218 family)